jgi:hypothetical protein
LIRSLSRENTKSIQAGNSEYINRLKSCISSLERRADKNRNDAIRYSNAIYDLAEKYNIKHEEVRELLYKK